MGFTAIQFRCADARRTSKNEVLCTTSYLVVENWENTSSTEKHAVLPMFVSQAIPATHHPRPRPARPHATHTNRKSLCLPHPRTVLHFGPTTCNRPRLIQVTSPTSLSLHHHCADRSMGLSTLMHRNTTCCFRFDFLRCPSKMVKHRLFLAFKGSREKKCHSGPPGVHPKMVQKGGNRAFFVC